jgi:hypothetical protein
VVPAGGQEVDSAELESRRPPNPPLRPELQASRAIFARPGPRADINWGTNRHRTAETFGQILSWLLETVRLRSAPELAVGARADN